MEAAPTIARSVKPAFEQVVVLTPSAYRSRLTSGSLILRDKEKAKARFDGNQESRWLNAHVRRGKRLPLILRQPLPVERPLGLAALGEGKRIMGEYADAVLPDDEGKMKNRSHFECRRAALPPR